VSVAAQPLRVLTDLGHTFLGYTIRVGSLAFFKTPSNQIQEHLHARAFIEKIDHLLNAEPSLLASDDQSTNRPE
jgi:hypothetical protein